MGRVPVLNGYGLRLLAEGGLDLKYIAKGGACRGRTGGPAGGYGAQARGGLPPRSTGWLQAVEWRERETAAAGDAGTS